jgi:hypothetical protein
MLVYAKRAAPKEPKRRSRAGKMCRYPIGTQADKRSDERLYKLVSTSIPSEITACLLTEVQQNQGTYSRRDLHPIY